MNIVRRILPIVAILIAACGGSKTEGGKKLLVISSGKFTVSEDQKTITWEPGGQHNEQVLEFGGDKVSITVKGPDGDKPYELAENGAWLLNLKKDTVVGGIINYGTGNRPASISAEQLDHMVDSTEKLLLGQNTNDNKGPFFIPPMTIKKISSNTSSNLYSPYKLIPYKVEVDEKGNAPESYKFYTNTQKREELADLFKRMSK